MFHMIDHIIKASDETLRLLAKDARRRAETGVGGQYKLNQELIAEAAERELELRGRNHE